MAFNFYMKQKLYTIVYFIKKALYLLPIPINMSLHKGKILQNAIKESGVSITKIVEKVKKKYNHIKCSRARMYHLFKEEEIDDGFLLKVGSVIYHDFSDEIPSLAQNKAVKHSDEDSKAEYKRFEDEFFHIRQEYARLQHSYIELLGLLTKVANQNNDVALKKAIENFLDRVEK